MGLSLISLLAPTNSQRHRRVDEAKAASNSVLGSRNGYRSNLPCLRDAPHIDVSLPPKYISDMSLAQLKDQAKHLDLREQRELIAFLISRQTEQDEDFKRSLAQKIGDTDPSHWVELDDLQKRYSE